MQRVVKYIVENKDWLGAMLTAVLTLAGWLTRRRYSGSSVPHEPIERLGVHIQSLKTPSTEMDESPGGAVLGIYISNATDHDVTITRASFDPTPKRFGIRRRNPSLPIHESAFKDRRTRRYELKFGNYAADLGVTVARGGRAFTFLPLARPVAGAELEKQCNGVVILEYDTPNGRRAHAVRV